MYRKTINKSANIIALLTAACCLPILISCTSLKTPDDFISEYCKCAQAATNDIEHHKCEVYILEKMAEQMKLAREQSSTQQAKMQSIINEISQKLIEVRKKCGNNGTQPTQ